MTAGDAKQRHPPPGSLAGGAPPPVATSTQSPPPVAVAGPSSSGWMAGPRRAFKRALCGPGSVQEPQTEPRRDEDPKGIRPPANIEEDRPLPAGLLNVGDTCYFNAVVQVLFHTPGFRSSLLAYQPSDQAASVQTDSDDNALAATKLANAEDIATSLQRLFIALSDHGGYSQIDPSEMVDMLRDKNRELEFEADGQQDAHEFLRFLLENVSTALAHADSALEEESSEIANSTRPKRVADKGSQSPRPLKRPKTVVPPNGIGSACLVASRFPVEEEVVLDGSCEPPPTESTNVVIRAPIVSGPVTPSRVKPSTTGGASVHSSTTKAPIDPKGPALHVSNGRVPKLQPSTSVTVSDTKPSVNKKTGENKQVPAWDPDLVRSIFGGESVTSTRCCECETESARPESFLDLSIPVRLGRSLSGSFTAMAAGDMLVGQDKYACDVCQTKTEAERRLYLSNIPPVLTVHLKLFQYTATQAGAKIPVSTPCPLRMRFDRWCTRKCAQKAPEYLLTAAIVHAGGCSTSGHYYAYIFNQESKQWYLFDDSSVTAVAESVIKKTLFSSAKSKKTGYLLFYSAIDD